MPHDLPTPPLQLQPPQQPTRSQRAEMPHQHSLRKRRAVEPPEEKPKRNSERVYRLKNGLVSLRRTPSDLVPAYVIVNLHVLNEDHFPSPQGAKHHPSTY